MTDLTCESALDRMLEAAPAELRGEADTELARHIAGCERCRKVAAAMLAELDAVDSALAEFAAGATEPAATADPAVNVMVRARAAADAAADAALAASRAAGAGDVVSLADRRPPAGESPPEAAGSPRSPKAARGFRGRGRTRAAWIPLAAAAALAAVLVFRQNPSLPTDVPAPEPESVVRPVVSVTTPPDRNAAIMETENPNITIVWLFDREES